MAADARPGHAGMARMVCLAAPALYHPAVGRSTPARRRVRHKAQKKGRTPSATACLRADWVRLVTTLAATAGPRVDVLRL